MRYNQDKTVVTSKIGKLTTYITHRKVHTAYLCMGGQIKDIYINGIAYSYVCVTRRQVKSKRAIFARMRERANIQTNGIRVRFKPHNRKLHKAKHANSQAIRKIQITTFY